MSGAADEVFTARSRRRDMELVGCTEKTQKRIEELKRAGKARAEELAAQATSKFGAMDKSDDPPHRRGMILALEGCDNNGKSQILMMLAQYFVQHYKDSTIVLELPLFFHNKEVRNYVFDQDGPPQQLMMMADHLSLAQCLSVLVNEEDMIVLCSRSVLSAVIYGGVKGEVSPALLESLLPFAVWPSLTYILSSSSSPEDRLKRAPEKSQELNHQSAGLQGVLDAAYTYFGQAAPMLAASVNIAKEADLAPVAQRIAKEGVAYLSKKRARTQMVADTPSIPRNVLEHICALSLRVPGAIQTSA